MPQRVTDLSGFLDRVQSINPHFDVERVQKAFECAETVYDGEMHWTGMTMLEHVVGVFEIMLSLEPDEDAMVACLLHHAYLVKNGMTPADIEEQFGQAVRQIVVGVHLLSNITLKGRRNSIDDLRLILLSASDDVRAILIGFCDRCHVLEHLENVPLDEARSVASDVLHLYAPVAARLGIYRMKHELENRAFPISYPSDAQRILEQLKNLHAETGHFLDTTAMTLKETFETQGIPVEIESRKKHIYSIFRKMKEKSFSSIADVKDLFALRVIVDRPEQCYQILGVLHKIGRPVTNRFKDYISFPKPNGYQSLHTTLVHLPHVPEDAFVEIQIRTHKMHREAKFGIAAHWSYKEQGSTARAMEQAQLHRMISSQETMTDVANELEFADHIFVLTPTGDVIELPEGATPLDFAFQVHTDLGLSFRSAKVNGSIVPLDYHLENGDSVEILRFRDPKPSEQWMQLLKMASSRSKLKRFLYAERRDEFLTKGRIAFNEELIKRKLPPLDKDLSVMRLYDGSILPLARREDILMKLGQGSERVSAVFSHLDALKKTEVELPKKKKRSILPLRKEIPIELDGGVPLPMRYAKCCKPHPDEKSAIVGIVGRGGKVMIHHRVCPMVDGANPQRKIGARWRIIVEAR